MSPEEKKIIDLMIQKNKFLLLNGGAKHSFAINECIYEAFKEYAEYKSPQPRLENEAFEKAITYAQETYFDGTTGPALMLGNVAELIELLTSRKVDVSVLQKYSI